jgi:hypothetical protein
MILSVDKECVLFDSNRILFGLSTVDIVGVRFLAGFNNIGGESERILEIIGCERLRIDENIIVCGEDFI